MKTIHGFIFLNLIVFLLWTLSPMTVSQEFLIQNFLVSWDALLEGRFWVLLTSVFSHLHFFHFMINMLVLRSFGPVILYAFGKRVFISFYLLAGIFSSFSHAALSMLLMHDPSLPALGASGAIAGLILLFSLLFPNEKILFFGIIPVRAIWGAVLFIGLDVWGLIAQSKGGGLPIGHGAHLGGAFVGILFFLSLRRR
jgi:membrane associated rhomboid family serine protease